MQYRAFISYSHEQEKDAQWLMRRLESYKVPKNLVGTMGLNGPIPEKLGRVFRDRDELASASDLSDTIATALGNSQSLIIICSPSAAQSHWVNAEVQAFRGLNGSDNIYSFVVAGDPSSQDPEVGCFPPALIEPDRPGAPQREPLAADARKQGDGRQRAFLKLVAGLLGVGFDSLAQREAQKRQRRMATITTLSLAGMALAIGLAITASVARNDAERRQQQAEDILGFMLGDLRENLTKVGRLDLMHSVDDKATDYFSTLNARDLSDRALEEQARSLTGIGEVRLNEGNHEEAMVAFREAHSRSTALYERSPDNGQRLFDLSQAEYWIGFVGWQQGRMDDAVLWLSKYRDSAVRLAKMDPENSAWQREAAYGHHNLAVLDKRLGHFEKAEQSMLAELDLYAVWLKESPQDFELRWEYANVISWLGSLALQQGDLTQAERFFVEQNEVIQKNVNDDSGNIEWREIQLDALLLLVNVQVQLGKIESAVETAQAALTISDQLVNHDPLNNAWLGSQGIATYWSAVLSGNEKALLSTRAENILRKVHETEPRDEIKARWFV